MRTLLLLWLLSLVCLPTIESADPACSRGIKSTNNADICCPSYCGVCDQGDCASRPGGYYECCALGVRQKNQQCNSAEPPCVMAPPQSGRYMFFLLFVVSETQK